MTTRIQPSGRAAVTGLILACAAALPAAAVASGSSDGGADDGDAYHKGKTVLKRDLACPSCPLERAPRSADEARAVIQRLRSGELGAGLDRADRAAVTRYLERRFEL